ncbi:MAG: 2-C-methyl-D-erythritol 2,4-cyclodiphosphate synthase [Leptospiraceae bacterium]|nr:2-C-methyl-D-erythritol 2,4-cyclodiphosphate synthase [Leptospiraceae bacterium]MCP5512518.1 2-C-methyl-D-erythritol 2,4-cyclodiphosphate synthase [Leptospiraceae bacterium]
MLRIGNGIDFHRMETNPERKLLLGGVEIPSDLAFIGHSDADVLIHAISDAILGALSQGDIGILFPDTDDQYKNMDSMIILNRCLEIMHGLGFHIVNLDSTIVGQKPKIAPHRDAIRENLSRVLKLSPDCVSVKATTTEKMGALGREEGVGVFTTILLEK